MLSPIKKISQYDARDILEKFCEKTDWEVKFCDTYLKYNKSFSCVTTPLTQEMHDDEDGNYSLDYLRSRIRTNKNGFPSLAFWYIVMYLRGVGELPRNECIVVKT